MNDLCCLLAGLINLGSPAVLVLLWNKKTGARLFPALAAFLICFPVFIMGNAIRSGFDRSSYVAFYIQQALLYGVLEESTKYLMMRYWLTSYDNRKDSVNYSIGHGAYEQLGIGLSCFGMIGTGASPAILFFQIWSVALDTISGAAVAVIIFYGIRREKSIVTLPAAILSHALCNVSAGIFIAPVSLIPRFLVDLCMCYAGYRCWIALKSPFEEDY